MNDPNLNAFKTPLVIAMIVEYSNFGIEERMLDFIFIKFNLKLAASHERLSESQQRKTKETRRQFLFL